jgi:hypothetical protein
MRIDNCIKLYIYKKLTILPNKFYETANIKEIEKEEHMQNIKRDLPQILCRGFQVWCRNAIVSHIATHCNILECKYKNSKDDIANGCSKCLQFQITTPGNNWESAKHIYDFASVEIRGDKYE